MTVRGTDLNRALVIFLGRGRSLFPHRDSTAVLATFGPVRGRELLRHVEGLLDETLDCKVDWSMHTLASARSAAEERMRQRHAELDHEAIAALGWAFDFAWR